ncbi:MAG TPA: hypothetical protein VK797_06265 [Tepidisphaeraceae bacterium]|nr:hypothetical protein [Tepidisphaeraceae bacterium]
MSCFIQSLESRTFLSATPVTKATLLADEAAIVLDAIAVKTDLKSLFATVVADTKTVQADLKGLPKTNAPLLHTLKTDEAKTGALIKQDTNALLGPSLALVNRSTAAGIAQIAKSNATIQAKVAADVAALGTVTTAPLAKLEADSMGGDVGTDLQAIATANPSDTTLAADIAKQKSDTNTAGTTFDTAAVKFQTDIGAFAADLAAAPAGGGGVTGSVPNLVGTFNGSATTTAGNHVGRVSTLAITISTESTTGALTGSITITNSGQAQQATLTGSVTSAGHFSATLVDSSNNTTTLSATVSGKTISGTYVSTNDSGHFSVTKQ